MRDMRGRHLLGDAAAQPDDPDLLHRIVARQRGAAGRRRPACNEGVEVLMGDAAGRPAAGHLAQVDAGFLRAQAHRRRGQRLLALAPWRAGGEVMAGFAATEGPAACRTSPPPPCGRSPTGGSTHPGPSPQGGGGPGAGAAGRGRLCAGGRILSSLPVFAAALTDPAMSPPGAATAPPGSPPPCGEGSGVGVASSVASRRPKSMARHRHPRLSSGAPAARRR